MTMESIQCARCGNRGEPMPAPPFPNDFGERIQQEICQSCWGEWLHYQTMLINHYGLNLRDPEARNFLLDNTEKFLFKTGEAEEVDTSKQGTINW
ncbi:MAG: oxidative damage protection protein [Longimicrobiaceae bacterium]